MRQKKKHLDFELNLVPFIDLLSTCICFLLITAVWLNVGSLNVKQAVGGQSVAESSKNPLVWLTFGEKGDLLLEVKEAANVPANLKKLKVDGIDGHLGLEQLSAVLQQVKAVEPTLRTALIQPKSQTSYEDIVDVMDQFKKSGLADLGISPL